MLGHTNLPAAGARIDDRASAILTHPLYTHSVLLQTPPIDDIYLTVKRAILLRDSGWVFTGDSGIGKTDALERTQALVAHEYPTLSIFTHDAHNQQIPSIRAFFKHFLVTVGHDEIKGETFDLRLRLVRTMIDRARTSGLNLIVLFIDEANAMMLQDFLFLKDVHNDLARAGIQLVTFLVGQSPDLESVIEGLSRDGRHDLTSRFATKIQSVRAFDSADDLCSLFKAIDCKQHPEGSGIYWPQILLPRAWSAGFRLEHEAQNAFNALAAGVDGASPRKIVIPARPLFVAIRDFLMRCAAFDGEELRLPPELWRDCILHARLAEAARRAEARMSGLKPRQKTKKAARIDLG